MWKFCRGADYNTTIYTGLLNNDGPDVVYVTDTYDLVSNGLLLKLDDKLTQEQKDNFLKWEDGAKDKDGNHYSFAFRADRFCCSTTRTFSPRRVLRFRKTPGLGKSSSTPARPSLKRPTRRLSFRTGAPAPAPARC